MKGHLIGSGRSSNRMAAWGHPHKRLNEKFASKLRPKPLQVANYLLMKMSAIEGTWVGHEIRDV